jgi:hypothetical protein
VITTLPLPVLVVTLVTGVTVMPKLANAIAGNEEPPPPPEELPPPPPP